MECSIRPLLADDPALEQLAGLLVEVVAAGGSVSFMHPMPIGQAQEFWRDSLARAAAEERIVLAAFDGARLLGTVTVLLAFPPNQPHRAEIAKMMTRPDSRKRGVATALLERAEQEAARRGKRLLVLDTASDGGAARLYESLGYTLAGEIPDFALKPHGGLSGTLIYWKRLSAQAAS